MPDLDPRLPAVRSLRSPWLPMAVIPEHRRTGIGERLILHGVIYHANGVSKS